MTPRRHQAVSWLIWGLVLAFAAVDAAFWYRSDVQLTTQGVSQIALSWAIIATLALIATRRIGRLAGSLFETEDAHRASRSQVEQLQMHNAILESLARSVDVPLAFGAIAPRVARLVPCDRLGLALLTEDGGEFQTYTARVNEHDRRSRPRPEIVFKLEGTAIGSVVKSGKPWIIDDTSHGAPDYLDMNVAFTSGFESALILPLISKDHAVGTLNVVSRRRKAFNQQHVEALLPLSEILGMAHVAQQLQAAVARHRAVVSMTELTLGVATEINGALQTIIGQCDLIDRACSDPSLQHDLATVVRQARRIASLLDKMRSASSERLNQLSASVRSDMES